MGITQEENQRFIVIPISQYFTHVRIDEKMID
jgi:hypothetical protein